MAELSIKAQEIQAERKKLKRGLTLLPLAGMIYFTVCGGSFGSESLVGLSGPGMALLLLAITPIVFSIPNMLMVRELGSMMPAEGGYYHWVKQAFGPFVGFMTGWMNLVVSWVDVSLYPVLAATYLAIFIPALQDGITIGGYEISGSVLSWLVGVILIWLIAWLQIRGARLTGLTTNWIGILMLLPLILMSVLGFMNWARSGVTIPLPFLPKGETVTGAFSVGLFVVMWNYMGWELPTSAGDEIVNPKRTYPLAMVLVLFAAIGTYFIPMIAGLYGGAGSDGQYQMWGIDEVDEGAGIGPVLENYGVSQDQVSGWGVDTSSSTGWWYTDIAGRVGAAFSGEGSNMANILLGLVTISAVLSMTGLFIGNSLGSSRVPFALAADGMMPGWLVKVHPKHGTPWVSILISSVIFCILAMNTFAFLVVVDVFLNMMALVLQFLALWKLRFSHPDVPRATVPGGWAGLVVVTLAPFIIIAIAVYSQFVEEGLNSLWLALASIGVGAVVYFFMKKFVKPGIPDINPWEPAPETEE
jgi:amino acid transporter